MAMFQAKITHSTLTFSPFTSESMMTIGQVALDHMKQRIQSVSNNEDNQARPLKETYAQEKLKGRRVAMSGPRIYRGLPVRDWTLRGWTLQSCKVKVASEERVVIGPTTQQASMIILTRNKLDKMWGLSPSDKQAMYAVIREILVRVKSVRVIKSGFAKTA